MLLSTYINAEKRQRYEEFTEVVSATEKVLMKRFKRVVIRGKRGREYMCFLARKLKATLIYL